MATPCFLRFANRLPEFEKCQYTGHAHLKFGVVGLPRAVVAAGPAVVEHILCSAAGHTVSPLTELRKHE